MKGILADIIIQGHVDLLVVLMKAEPWKLFWEHLRLDYYHFTDLGLAPDSPDSLVWDACRRLELALITENRNKDESDSLEAAIRSCHDPSALPVFTIASVPRLRASRAYADAIIETFLDALLRIDTLRGTGRLYLP